MSGMKIAIASDHAGFQVKQVLKSFLQETGHQVTDCGPESSESCDYPDFAKKVAQAVSMGNCDRGVLICGTGIGMSMVANKFKNVRASLCFNEYTAEMSRRHNDANVFCAGARTLDLATIQKLLKIWLDTPFDEERHTPRVRKIDP